MFETGCLLFNGRNRFPFKFHCYSYTDKNIKSQSNNKYIIGRSVLFIATCIIRYL